MYCYTTTTSPLLLLLQLERSMAIYSNIERIERYGIDCGDGLEWEGGSWTPGGEYIKRLLVKNVSGELQRLKYKLPE